MRYLFWLIKFIAFIMLFGFAMHNSALVSLKFYLGYFWTAPLALILLVFFVSGAAIGLLANLGQIIRLRRELLVLRKEKRQAINASSSVNIDNVTPPRDAL